jgi:hypothetical protein
VVHSIIIKEDLIQKKRENFGRGDIEPIKCYNCNQMGHLARDFLNPCKTCTYCRELDHETQDYPRLLLKWKVRGNWNQNPNHNIQKISSEERNEGPRIAVVMHEGDRIGVDVTNEGSRFSNA